MDYYYTDGVNNFGPFSLDQLKEKNITSATRIWYSGLANWTPAGEIPELADIIGATPPPITPQTPPPVYNQPTNATGNASFTQSKPPKTWLVESILVTLFCCLPFGIAGIINAAKVETRFYAGDFMGAQQASSEAGKWTKIGFWIGLGVFIIYILYIIGIVIVAGTNGTSIDNFSPNF
ncbi:MAG: CD225/dispanin family protein [Bacteroidales bacterium]|nr:CD225/dispanin family protein [Bacteroidales bacterium]